MKSIKFKAAFGSEDRNVVVSLVSGSLGTVHIYINDYFVGSIRYVLDKWVVHWVEPTDKSVFKEMHGVEDSEAILDKLRNAGWID